jgi:hypothetical protein
MRVQRGHVVLTRGQEHLYKVILEYEWGEHSEHPVRTVKEGEALIRSRVYPPPTPEVEKLRQTPLDRRSSAASPTPGVSAVEGDLLTSIVFDDTPAVSSKQGTGSKKH